MGKGKIAVSKFWDRVEACEHKNLTNYDVGIGCGTPMCSSGESHCRDCGVYIETCGCMSCNGLYGWSYMRRKNWHLKNGVTWYG